MMDRYNKETIFCKCSQNWEN